MNVVSLRARTLCLIWAACAASCLAGPSKIHWITDYPTAVRLAAKTHRLLVVDFYANYCPDCHKLEKLTYPSAKLASFLNSGFIPVKLNVEIKKNIRVANKFDVSPLPDIVVITPAGRAVGDWIGYKSPAAFMAAVHQLASQARQRP